MRIPEKWLRQYCNPPLDGDELEHLLTMGGVEVEAREPVAAPFSGVVAARIIRAEKHPNADRLQVCQVEVGQSAPVQIVCGAPNARAGLVTACALPGAVLPGDFRIRKTRMRGVESAGMLCSAQELRMESAQDGILELPPTLAPGVDLRQALDLDEAVLTLKVTPNLAHAMSVLGVAREVAALADVPVQEPHVTPLPASTDTRLPVRIEEPALCGRFAGRVIRGVNAAATTPEWMRQRLLRAGQRPVSALVDISNYVLIESGQPTHIFDLNRLKGSLHLRWGRAGETLTLLNGQTVSLEPDARGLPVGVICDDHGPVSLAGIMGGQHSAVDPQSTTDVYLESAFWWPAAVMGRPRRYNFTTDAAQRFERGVDAEAVVDQLEYLSRLVVEICGGQPGPLDDQVTSLPERPSVRLRLSRLQRVSGLPLTADDCRAAFRRLGFAFGVVNGAAAADTIFEVRPPSRRFDIAIEEDLIEEVIRLYGYDRIPVRPPIAQVVMRPVPEARLDVFTLKRRWAMRDYQEVINFSFVASADDSRFRADGAVIRVQNPIAGHMDVMRTTLWSGLLANLQHNLNRKAERVRLFEVGRVYLPAPGQPAGPLALAGIAQPERLAVLCHGTAFEPQWGTSTRDVDFFDLKGDLQAAHPEARLQFVAAEYPGLHPGQSARIQLPDGQAAGWMGALHPALIEQLDLPGPVYLAELDWSVLQIRPVVAYRRESRFPPVIRDLAIVVDEQVPAADVMEQIYRIQREEPVAACIRHVHLFDQYRGKGLENKEKSLAFRFWMQHTDRTMSDEETETVLALVLGQLQSHVGARLR